MPLVFLLCHLISSTTFKPKELLKKEVLFKSDVENLIGKRAFEEKKTLDIPVAEEIKTEEPDSSLPDELLNPPKI